MPTYVYQVVTEDGSEGEVFEVVQKMSEAALKKHPETGAPVRRIPRAPHDPRELVGPRHEAEAERQEPRSPRVHEVRAGRGRAIREEGGFGAERDQRRLGVGRALPAELA